MDDRREVTRYVIDAPARLSESLTGPVVYGTIDSISVRGCRVQCKDIPEAGKKCHVIVQWEDRELRTDAEIVWKTASGEAGLKFSPLDDDQLEFLRQLCATLKMEPLAPPPPKPEENDSIPPPE